MPLEMMELVVMKAVSSLYNVYKVRFLPRADLLTLTSVMSVCHEWWKIITQYRPRLNRRTIRQQFRQYEV